MTKTLCAGLLLFLISGSAYGYTGCYPLTDEDLLLGNASVPAFAQFPAGQVFKGKPALPQLDSHAAKLFRTALREGSSQGPNFAGHYTVVVWGCGTACQQLGIVDDGTGQVLFPADFSVISSDHIDSDNIRFQLDSNLLIVTGSLDETGEKEGAFYYLLRQGKLEKIFSVLVKAGWCPETGTHKPEDRP